MPVQRFRSFDDARRALWCDHPDQAYFRRMAALWRLSAKLNPMTFPPGVYKYRSIEEANQARDHWLTRHVRSLRKERQAHQPNPVSVRKDDDAADSSG